MLLGTACLGTFGGGYLTKRFKMGPLTVLKFTVAMEALTSVFTGLKMVFKCDQPMLYNSPGYVKATALVYLCIHIVQ